MSERHSLEVYDKDGWCRTYPLQKPIVRIGSDSGNDVVLENERGDGVASLHAQLIASSENGTAYRLINLADSEIVLNPDNGETLLPRSAVDVSNAFTFIMGQFTLVFHTGSGAAHTEGKYATSVRRNIGLRLAVERTQLVPEEWINGVVTISNLGDLTGVQFELDLDGFDHDCFDLEPGPLLSSGAEKEVLFRLYHRNIRPSAGRRQITIRAAAPRAYPGEAASVTQTIEVLPFYRHQVSILAPGQADTPPEEQNLLAAMPMVAATSRPDRQSGAIPVADSTDLWSTSGSPVSGTRQAVAIKAKPPRPAPTDSAPDDDAEETEDWFTTPVESSAPPQAIPTTQEPLAAVPFGNTQPQPVSDEAIDLWGVSDEGSPGTQPTTQQPLPPATPQTETGDESDWWGTSKEANVSPAAAMATAAAVGAGVAAIGAKDDDDDTSPRPRRSKDESETPLADPLPPAAAPLPPVNVSPAANAETTRPAVEDVAQEWLAKADSESAKARRLADEVDQAIYQQAETNIDAPPEDLDEIAGPVATVAVLPKVEREQPPATETETETLAPAQSLQPTKVSAEDLPAQEPTTLWARFKQKLPFASDSDEVGVAESASDPEKPVSPMPVEEPVGAEPSPQAQVEPEPVVPETEPDLPQTEEAPLQIDENEQPETEADIVDKGEAELSPSIFPEGETELPPVEKSALPVEETGLPKAEANIVSEVATESPVFPEAKPKPPQTEEPLQLEKEPIQVQSKPETGSLLEPDDWFADEATTEQKANTDAEKPETKAVTEETVEDEWWDESFETGEKPRQVLKLKSSSTDKLTIQPPKTEENPEDWWSDES